jgi:hypothetical protein
MFVNKASNMQKKYYVKSRSEYQGSEVKYTRSATGVKRDIEVKHDNTSAFTKIPNLVGIQLVDYGADPQQITIDYLAEEDKIEADLEDSGFDNLSRIVIFNPIIRFI